MRCARPRDASVVNAIRTEVDLYLRRLAQLVYADGLPRVVVDVRRLVVVPHALLNAAAYQGMAERLGRLPEIAALDQSDALRDFLFLLLIADCDTAVARAKPSSKRPIAAGGPWVGVGVNTTFVWREFFNAPTWSGHHYVLEVTRDPMTRKLRKAIEAAISAFEASLPTLSVVERNEILRRGSSVVCT